MAMLVSRQGRSGTRGIRLGFLDPLEFPFDYILLISIHMEIQERTHADVVAQTLPAGCFVGCPVPQNRVPEAWSRNCVELTRRGMPPWRKG